MKSPTSLSFTHGSSRTVLLAVIAIAAVIAATALVVRSGSEPAPAAADSLSAPASSPASGAYIKLGDIKGEATEANHRDWINLISVSQGISRPGGGLSGSTRQRGSATFGDVVVVKELDKSSPKLQEAIATGQTFPVITLDLTSLSGGASSEQPYFQWELKNVVVSNYRITGDSAGNTRPIETFSLNFEEIKVTYTEQDNATGQASGKIDFSWKVEEGTK